MHLPEGKINNLLGMINSAIQENSELQKTLEDPKVSTEKALQIIADKVPEVQEAINQNPSEFKRAIDEIGTEPQGAPGTAPIPTDTSASSRGVVGPKSPLDTARDKLDEMIRKGNFDSRVTAKLSLLKSQLAKTEHTDALIELVNRISNDLGLIANAVEAANEAQAYEISCVRHNRSEQNRAYDGHQSWEYEFFAKTGIPYSKRPNFEELVSPGKPTSMFVATTKHISEIKGMNFENSNLPENFLKTETAKKALGNSKFDLGTLFEADLISQLGSEHINAIEEMRRNNPEAFKAFAVLSALQPKFPDAGNAFFNHPQLPPDINPVVQKCVGLIRSGGDITDPQVFAELLKGQHKALTGEDL
jgi:hypothetical protein